jgi:hypothetical protein
MRIIEEISHPACKITIFQWNGKYIVKFETASMEQSYKISEQDVMGLGDVKKIINNDFITKVYQRFLDMNKDVKEEFEKVNLK